jgi:hypothetical protein
MILNTLREIKERGIRNIISEEIEKLKELGVAGYLKAKAEEVKETASSTVMGAQRKLIGDIRSRETANVNVSDTYTFTDSGITENVVENVGVRTGGYSRERIGI